MRVSSGLSPSGTKRHGGTAKLGAKSRAPFHAKTGFPQGDPVVPQILQAKIVPLVLHLVNTYQEVQVSVYADDLWLDSDNKQQLQEAHRDVVEAFQQLGLQINTKKCVWSAHDPGPEESPDLPTPQGPIGFEKEIKNDGRLP